MKNKKKCSYISNQSENKNNGNNNIKLEMEKKYLDSYHFMD